MIDVYNDMLYIFQSCAAVLLVNNLICCFTIGSEIFSHKSLCYRFAGCINCVALGDAQIIQPDTSCCGCTNIVTKEVELANEQFQWLEDQKTTGGGTKSIEQEVVNACMKIDEYTVFGVIRCKSSVAKCEGAQEAVENIQKQFGKEKGEVVTKENIDICAKDCGCD